MFRTFPNIQRHCNVWRLHPDAHWNDKHIGDNVIQTQRDKGKDGPPKSDDFGSQIAALHAKIARQTHQPVAPDSLQKDLIERWDSLLFVHKLLDSSAEGVSVENATICDMEISMECTPECVAY